jgi:hypothetical protein
VRATGCIHRSCNTDPLDSRANTVSRTFRSYIPIAARRRGGDMQVTSACRPVSEWSAHIIGPSRVEQTHAPNIRRRALATALDDMTPIFFDTARLSCSIVLRREVMFMAKKRKVAKKKGKKKAAKKGKKKKAGKKKAAKKGKKKAGKKKRRKKKTA